MLLLSMCVNGEELTATVVSYHAAELSGDIDASMWVEFYASSESKGSIYGGQTAELSIGGMPKGVITKICLWMKSNKNSGAGGVTCSIDEQTCFSQPDASFADWVGTGEYSTTYIPVCHEGTWSLSASSVLNIIISASENSLYIDKVVVSYQPAPPEAYDVRLVWCTADGEMDYVLLQESEPGEGVVLPTCEVSTLNYADTTWTMVGWTDSLVQRRCSMPRAYYTPAQRYYPSAPTTLYAYYRDTVDCPPLEQDTLLTNGEYALMDACLDTYYLAAGPVEASCLAAVPCIAAEDSIGRMQLHCSFIPLDYRYRIEITDSTMTITHIDTQTRVGHSSTALTINDNVWQYSVTGSGRYVLYYNAQTDGSARVFCTMWESDGVVYEVNKLLLSLMPGIVFFPVEDIPYSPQPMVWTGCPMGRYVPDAAIDIPSAVYSSGTKLYRDGRVYVLYNGHCYLTDGTLIY